MKLLLKIIRRISLFFLDIVETGVIALSIFVVVYLFILQPHEVKGNSMLPNFEHGQFLITDKITYRLKEPSRGDVVVFKAPVDTRFDYIKRIIGLPGEEIKIQNNQIFINGQKLEEIYLPESFVTRAGQLFKNNQSFTLEPDQYLVMGDNREHSSDSREWGPVPKENLVGRVWLRYWPLNKIGKIKKEEYEFTNSS
ncbi:MAG: signal peptidase I [Candidatus Pacebacteria bacterium]|nr:signal peptidase I [Candidatus Paceibacterota bacterium]